MALTKGDRCQLATDVQVGARAVATPRQDGYESFTLTEHPSLKVLDAELWLAAGIQGAVMEVEEIENGENNYYYKVRFDNGLILNQLTKEYLAPA